MIRSAGLVRSSLEALWAAAFGAAGRLRSPAVERWQSPGGQTVVIVAPHPDDEVIGCAGTLIRHGRVGDRVCIVYVSDGSASRAGGHDREQMARVRRREAAAAVRALGASHYEWLGLPEGDWPVAKLEEELRRVFAQLAPDILYAPSRIDFHPEHHRVAHALALVLGAATWTRRTPIVRIYQAQVPLTPILTNLVVETEAVSAETRAAFAAHASQRSSIARSLRMRRYAGRYYQASAEAEELWQLTDSQYSELHDSACASWSRYSSLRDHPIYDPRAYSSRLGERRMLARQVQCDVDRIG